SPLKTGQQLKKVAHNAIERRYRNNINDRIHDLKNVVPALYKARIREKKDEKGRQETVDEMEEDESTDSQESGEIVEGVEVAKKLNKATILHKATEYIHYLKYTNEMTRRENQLLE
ncbi:HLH-domain-containing protein, partial [Backusella circina FSU 941]